MKKKVTETKMGINEAIKQLKSANHIALFCHVNPDCDTICSALALRLALQKTGKKIDVYCDGELKGEIRDVKGVDTINSPSLRSYDLSVAIDCGDQGRIGKYYSIFAKSPKTLCIDHHNQLSSFADVNIVDVNSGATAELIYLILQEMDPNLPDVEIATLLYTALVTDTGNFSFSNTGARTFEIASKLLAFGVKNAEISYRFFKEITLKRFKLKARVIDKAQFFENDQIGVITFTKEDLDATGTTSADSSNLVNDLINIAEVRVALSITEVRPHSYKISIRTQDDVDAGSIANTFGGGGHKNAAGCMLNGFYGNILDDLLKACRDHL